AIDRQIRGKDASQLVGARVRVHQRLPWRGNLEERVAARGHLPEPGANGEHQIRVLDPASELRVDADSDVAGIERMIVVEQVLVPERASHRELPAFGEPAEVLAGLAGPASPTQDGDRPVRALQQRSQPADLLWRWRRGRAPGARR